MTEEGIKVRARPILVLKCFLCHLDVEKLRYRATSDSTFVVSVEK